MSPSPSAAAAVPILTLALFASPLAPAAAAAVAVDAEALRRHVEYLADDALEGRDTGSPGIHQAEEYIAAEFARAGLSPLPDQANFFVRVDLVRDGFDAERSSLRFQRGDHTWDAEAETDFRPFPFSKSADVTAGVVFAGYGITSAEHEWDDYAGLDVQGKIVVVLRYEPEHDDPDSRFDGTNHTPHAYFTTKARNAREHGAIGMIVVQGPLHDDEPRRLPFGRDLSLRESSAVGGGSDGSSNDGDADADDNDNDNDNDRIVAVHVRRVALQPALRHAGIDLRELQEALEKGTPPAQLPQLDCSAHIQLARDAQDAVAARNVVGWVEGSDPVLSREIVVVGAHHDHVGTGGTGSDRIFNGADDNASGTAVLLELARAWQQLEPRPARSMVFATFTAEEKGLLGSRALVAGSALPLERVRFMVNLDMVGRNSDRDVRVFGDPSAVGLRELVQTANETVDLPLAYVDETLPGNSDHSSFRRADIPVLFFFTGTHDDYHRPGDHADKLDYERMADIGTLTLGLLQGLTSAQPEAFPYRNDEIHWLGITLRSQSTATGLTHVVSAVDAGSTADAAGVQQGDVLATFDGTELRGRRDAPTLLRDCPVEREVELVLQRDNQQRKVHLTRPQPGFLGIAYAALSARERERWDIPAGTGVLVQQVLADGPAAAADLREGDIILRVGQRPAQHQTLAGRVQAIGADHIVELEILRDGKILERSVRLAHTPPAG